MNKHTRELIFSLNQINELSIRTLENINEIRQYIESIPVLLKNLSNEDITKKEFEIVHEKLYKDCVFSYFLPIDSISNTYLKKEGIRQLENTILLRPGYYTIAINKTDNDINISIPSYRYNHLKDNDLLKVETTNYEDLQNISLSSDKEGSVVDIKLEELFDDLESTCTIYRNDNNDIMLVEYKLTNASISVKRVIPYLSL